MSPEKDQIIEIGAVVMDEGAVVDTFQSLVRPDRPIPEMVSALTGITDAEAAAAPSLDAVLPTLLRLLEGRTVVAHNASFDLAFLRTACEREGYELPCSEDALDTLILARFLMPFEPDHRLQSLAARLDIDPGQAHRALADATATAGLLQHLQVSAEALAADTLDQLTRLAALFSQETAAWLNQRSERRLHTAGTSLPANTQQIRGLVFSSPTQSTGTVDAEHTQGTGTAPQGDLAESAAALLGENSPLREKLPGFAVRDGQVQMVQAVADALAGDQHLVVEAGTGTGKSMAYLVPAALYALAEDTRVVIATHTIALQDQIATRDFPVLQDIIQAPLALTVFKGRTHYVCMRKVLQEVNHIGFGADVDEVVAYMAMLVWLTSTEDGTREELSLKGRGASVWPRVQSETESCVNKRCPFFKPCYYFRARGKAQEADLIVTNHSLVFSDLKADHRVLPKYGKLIFDEAHHLEEGATKHLGEETHSFQCSALFGRLVRDHERGGVLPEIIKALQDQGGADKTIDQLSDLAADIGRLRQTVDTVFDALAQLVPPRESEYRLTPDLEGSAAWQAVLDTLDDMTAAWDVLSEGAGLLESLAEREGDSDLANRMYDAAGFMPELQGNLDVLASAPQWDEQWVTWLEVRQGQGRRQVGLYRSPIDVATLLQTRLFEQKDSVVLTSATLSVNNSFDYTKSQLGLVQLEQDGRLQTLAVPSPFSFAKQALLCVPSDVPDLSRMQAEEASVWLSDSLYQLAKASDGRVLALFTSHAMLRATADALRGPLTDAGYQLFAQGIDGSRTQLLEAFRQTGQSVLLGAQSFWEGIDLPGDELRTLVIIRLPFAPPTHPVTKARHERLEQGGKSAFWHASLPDAVVRFRQGFGRLIRRVTDRGVVVVYDKRIIQSKYGATFIRSLPGMRPFVAEEAEVMKRIAQFFAQQP